MSTLSGFIIVIIAITFQLTLYTIKRLREPLEADYPLKFTSNKMQNQKPNYWKNAEITNGRLAMMGLFALVINYGFFGWIIPGFF